MKRSADSFLVITIIFTFSSNSHFSCWTSASLSIRSVVSSLSMLTVDAAGLGGFKDKNTLNTKTNETEIIWQNFQDLSYPKFRTVQFTPRWMTWWITEKKCGNGYFTLYFHGTLSSYQTLSGKWLTYPLFRRWFSLTGENKSSNAAKEEAAANCNSVLSVILWIFL